MKIAVEFQNLLSPTAFTTALTHDGPCPPAANRMIGIAAERRDPGKVCELPGLDVFEEIFSAA